jgi:hypothetical protein
LLPPAWYVLGIKFLVEIGHRVDSSKILSIGDSSGSYTGYLVSLHIADVWSEKGMYVG